MKHIKKFNELNEYYDPRPKTLNIIDIEDVKLGDYFIHQDKTIDEREEILKYVVKITKLYKDDENFSAFKSQKEKFRNSVQFNAICIWPDDLMGFTIVSNDYIHKLDRATPEEIEEYEMLNTTNKYNI